MSEGAWHRVADTDALAVGSVVMAKAGDRLVAVVRTEAGYHALDNACPHRGGPLAQGTLEDGRLVCPWHGRAYDLTAGTCDGFAETVRVYPVEAREDGLYVAVEA